MIQQSSIDTRCLDEGLQSDPIHGEATLNCIRHLTSLIDKARVVDLGCGTGRMSTYWLLRGCIVYGSDVDLGALREAKNRLAHLNVSGRAFFINTRSESLAIASATMDVAFLA
jgi:predicted RNA methylase